MHKLTALLVVFCLQAALARPTVQLNKEEIKLRGALITVQRAHLDSPAAPAFDQAVKTLEENQIKSFKKDLSDPDLKSDIQWSLDIQVKPQLVTDRYVSLLVEFEQDEQGAHPGHMTRSVLFDLKQGRVLRLRDLFRPDSDGLGKVARICQKELKARGKAQDMFAEGAKATEPNYSVFYLGPDSLTIFFDVYQVASYAEGPQEVKIPFNALRAVLEPSLGL